MAKTKPWEDLPGYTNSFKYFEDQTKALRRMELLRKVPIVGHAIRLGMVVSKLVRGTYRLSKKLVPASWQSRADQRRTNREFQRQMRPEFEGTQFGREASALPPVRDPEVARQKQAHLTADTLVGLAGGLPGNGSGMQKLETAMADQDSAMDFARSVVGAVQSGQVSGRGVKEMVDGLHRYNGEGRLSEDACLLLEGIGQIAMNAAPTQSVGLNA